MATVPATHFPPPPHPARSFDEEAVTSPPAADNSDHSPLSSDFTTTATDDSLDSAGLPELLYDDIDHPATSTTALLLTAQHNHATQQLQQTISHLTQQLAHTQQQLHDSQQQTAKYKAQCAVFVRNLSVLFDTAVSEVRRKQEEVDRLKEWKVAQERRTRIATAERQNNGSQPQYGATSMAVAAGGSGSVSSPYLPPPHVKRPHHTMHQPQLPQPPFPPPDLARKRARVDTG